MLSKLRKCARRLCMTPPWVFRYFARSLTRGSSAASRWRISANPLRKNLGEKLGSNPLHAAEHGSSNQGAKRTPGLAERRLPGASDGQNSASLDGAFSDRGGPSPSQLPVDRRPRQIARSAQL